MWMYSYATQLLLLLFKDRCGSGKKATNNNPLHRTFNRNCTGACIGSVDDYTKFNPWRAPGSAPVYDPCGRAGGGPRPTSGKGEYVTTAYAKLGDLGSKLPTMPSGAVWQAGSVVEALWSVRANHGGGWQFRLCPSSSALTEECFQQTYVCHAVLYLYYCFHNALFYFLLLFFPSLSFFFFFLFFGKGSFSTSTTRVVPVHAFCSFASIKNKGGGAGILQRS